MTDTQKTCAYPGCKTALSPHNTSKVCGAHIHKGPCQCKQCSRRATPGTPSIETLMTVLSPTIGRRRTAILKMLKAQTGVDYDPRCVSVLLSKLKAAHRVRSERSGNHVKWFKGYKKPRQNDKIEGTDGSRIRGLHGVSLVAPTWEVTA